MVCINTFHTDEMGHFCRALFQEAPGFLLQYSWGRGRPGTTSRGPPPCIFDALIVVVRIETLGVRPLNRLLTFQNFSKPMSAAKPLSVTW